MGSFKTTDKVNFNDAWVEIDKLFDTGKVRAIDKLMSATFPLKKKLFTTAKVTPAVSQVELRPYLAQNGLVLQARHRLGVALASNSIYSDRIFLRDDPIIVSLAEKYKVTTTQVVFGWHLSRNTIILPTSKNSERQKESITIRALLGEDLGKIWRLDRGQRLYLDTDPTTGQVFGWTLEQLGKLTHQSSGRAISTEHLGRVTNKFAENKECKIATKDSLLWYNLAKQKEIRCECGRVEQRTTRKRQGF